MLAGAGRARRAAKWRLVVELVEAEAAVEELLGDRRQPAEHALVVDVGVIVDHHEEDVRRQLRIDLAVGSAFDGMGRGRPREHQERRSIDMRIPTAGHEVCRTGTTGSHADTRIRQLNSTKMPIKVELVGAWTFENSNVSAEDAEKAAHYLLEPYNVNGEWFQDPDEDLADRVNCSFAIYAQHCGFFGDIVY